MNRLLYTIILLCTLTIIGGCSDRHKHVERNLADADLLMNHHPDSALVVLNRVDTTRLPPRLMAHYSLLLSKAQNKCNIIPGDDSLIRIAVDYYAGHGDSLEVQALFYLGSCQTSCLKTYDEALITLYEAMHKAMLIDDYFYIAMSARELAYVYGQLLNYPKKLEYGQIGKEYFTRAGMPLHAEYMNDEIIDALPRLGRAQEALDLSFKVDSATFADNAYFRHLILRDRLDAYDYLLRYADALAVYRELLADGTPLRAFEWARIGELCLNTGDIPGARAALDSAGPLRADFQDSMYYQLVETRLLGHDGRYKEAYNSALDWGYKVLRDGDKQLMNPATTLLTDYYTLKAQNESLVSRDKSRLIFMLVAACLILAAALIAVAYLHHIRIRLRSARISDLMMKIDALERDLSTSYREKDLATGHLSNLSQRVSGLKNNLDGQIERNMMLKQHLMNNLQRQLAGYNEMCEIWYRNSGRSDSSDRFYSGMVSVLKRIQTPDFTAEIETAINESDDRWMERFRSAVPNLTAEQYQLVIYLYLGFSATSLCVLLNKKSMGAVYMVKHKLKCILKSTQNDFAKESLQRLGLARTNS